MSETNSKLYYRVALLALLLPLASGDCSYLDLGMESRSIPDSKIKASSVQNASTPASNSRLNLASGSSWCAGTSDSNQYLQIDLQTLHIICAVSTQGNSKADQWVKSYTLQSSIDGSSWTNYSEIGQLKSLKGNEDRNSEVKHILNGGVLARYLLFLPETFHGAVCLRTEVFGVKQKPDNLALGKPTKQSSTYSNNLTGIAESGRAVDGNADTDMRNKHCSHTNKDNPSWWRVDLAFNHTAVYEIHIVNRFTGDPGNNNVDYKITFGSSTDVASNPECTGRYSFIQFKASAICFTNPLTTGRYVGIMTTKSQSLQLCEVEIYSRENLAFGKQTDQTDTVHDGLSTLGVDGNSETIYEGGSCTHTTNVKNAWWRVDLGQDEPVSEVYIVNRGSGWAYRLDNFEIRVGSDSSNGGVTNPKCGGPFSVPGEKGLSFFCRPPLYGKYVTIINIRQGDSTLTLCEVEVYSEKRACQIQALGVSSKDAFPDNSFSAFSKSGDNVASKGRLNGIGAWSPSGNNNFSDFLQINLQYEFFICAVATQGKSTEDHWTTKYKILLSLNNIDWVTYKENGTDKVFDGNSGRNDIVKHNLKEIARARFIRFQPITYSTHKALRVEVFGILKPAAPSQAPSSFVVSALSSTSVRATWQPPPAGSTHGAIAGFKLFYQRKNSAAAYPTVLTIQSNSGLSRDITGLRKYTEYEFQVLAFSYVGNGPKTSVQEVRTDEDAPSTPVSLGYTHVTPSSSHGPRIHLTWSKPAEPNGVIRTYTVSYNHSGNTLKEIPGILTLNYTVDVLGGIQYHFRVKAVTIKPGPNAVLTLDIPEYEPSVGPDNVTIAELNGTTYNISWAPLTREKSFGKVIMYDIKFELLSRGRRRKRSPINSRIVNTTSTFVVLYDLPLCSQYHVSVRAFTKVGPGPYTQPMVLETSRAPQEFKATSLETTQVTLEWKEPNRFSGEGLSYIVKYLGSKPYNQSFIDEGIREAHRSTTYTVRGLVPGSVYKFEVYVCENIAHAYLPNDVKTKSAAPIAPVVLTLMEKEVSQSSVQIHLWPVEQRNGPISTYQVIVLKVVDGTEELPNDYSSKLKDSDINNANEDNLNFYVAAEIENVPVHEESWEFTVGDGKTNRGYVNKGLETGQDYVVYQRALTYDKDDIFIGEVSKVARISVNKDVGGADETKGNDSASAVAIAVPVVLLILLIPAVLVAVFFYRRRKRSEKKSSSERATPLQLEDLRSGSTDTTSSSANLVYENLVDIRPSEEGISNVMEASSPKENELIYSEAEDGKPKPIPVAEFARYFKSSSENGAIVLREEFQNLPGGMQFPWEVGRNNKRKNRYGNITTYDHSRVVLEKIEGDPKSDYINASYMPTFDEETMRYIATQGPTPSTISDFWRMIWQEKCATIVMLTNLVEVGKGKCDQYWPDSNTKFGSIRVTLKKTENFADYVVRTFILVKEQQKREVLQFHYVTWPDKGVPQRSTALLAFRWKIHARHQATGGPLVVHCSAGVGRTGTYIGIDAMLEGAKEKKSVFIQNYVQVMRRCRPHMVQKEEQYVFLHQAVMEALTCGNTEVAPQDLRIAMNKLARTQKSSKQTGYEREFKRLQLVSDCQASGEESEKAFDSSNISKNRFPNIVPLDSARVFLRSSDPQKDYINASFVDDYKRRNAYILTQAPLNNTVEDFWRMISQYDIGTVVMLNSLGEDNESYPQYWPAKGSVEYGDITIQILSESTSNKITTRRFSVLNVEPPKKQSTVQHLHFTGWSSPDSCPDPQEILDLLTTVQQSQQQTGNGVIVFQCSDGIGRSGCVSSIMSAIERVKSEQTVDVFQTVKLIRARSPGAVDTLEKYVFCYKTILAYLDSFDAYANFANC